MPNGYTMLPMIIAMSCTYLKWSGSYVTKCLGYRQYQASNIISIDDYSTCIKQPSFSVICSSQFFPLDSYVYIEDIENTNVKLFGSLKFLFFNRLVID